MARSYIDPSLVAMAAEPAAPPWDWNPGATFLTAFNAAQENKRRNEDLAMEQELSRILFPMKKAQAEFAIKELEYESENLADKYKLLTEDRNARLRLLRSAGSSGGGAVSPANTASQNSAGLINTKDVNFRANTQQSSNNDTVDFQW